MKKKYRKWEQTCAYELHKNIFPSGFSWHAERPWPVSVGIFSTGADVFWAADGFPMDDFYPLPVWTWGMGGIPFLGIWWCHCSYSWQEFPCRSPLPSTGTFQTGIAVYRKSYQAFPAVVLLGMVVQGNSPRTWLGTHLLIQQYLAGNSCRLPDSGTAVAALYGSDAGVGYRRAPAGVLAAKWLLPGTLLRKGILASRLDATILGRFRDDPTYTWIWSSLTFGGTVMLGTFAGQIMKEGKNDRRKTVKRLFVTGLLLIAGGWLWGWQTPIIKRIWSCSMTLLSGGYCFLLMGIFFTIGWTIGDTTVVWNGWKYMVWTPLPPTCWEKPWISVVWFILFLTVWNSIWEHIIPYGWQLPILYFCFLFSDSCICTEYSWKFKMLKRMKIGIIYLTTEAYNKFWKDFYCICEQYFCVDAEKEYKLFTDSPESIGCASSANVYVRQIEDLGWIVNTSYKSEYICSIHEELGKIRLCVLYQQKFSIYCPHLCRRSIAWCIQRLSDGFIFRPLFTGRY